MREREKACEVPKFCYEESGKRKSMETNWREPIFEREESR